MLRKRTPVGIDIGSSGVKVAQLRRVSHRWEPRSLASREWDEGSTGDEMAFGEAFTSTVREAVQSSGAKGRRAVVSAPAYLVDIRPITAPVSDNVDLGAHVQTELLERHAESADHFVTDFWVTGEIVEHGETKLGLYSVSARSDRIISLVRAVEKAGLDCIRVETAATSLGHAVAAGRTEEDCRSLIVVDVGKRCSQLLALDANGLGFCRLFNWGTQNIAGNIKRSLDIDTETATQLMIECGLRSTSPIRAGEDLHPRQQQINDSIERELRVLALEIGRSLAYRARGCPDGEVGTVHVSGGGSRLRGLREFIKDALKLDVDSLNVLGGVDRGNGRARETSPDQPPGAYGVAIGAALAGVN